MPSVTTVLAVCGIVLLAATLQRTVGFGFALIALPPMAVALPTKSAVVVVFLIGAVTSTWLALRLRRDVEIPTTRLLAVGTLAGEPVGVAVLRVVSAATLRVAMGTLISLAAIATARHRRATAVRARPARTVAVGFASGVLSTSLATNGPPLVCELRRSGFHDDRFRATISAAFVVSNLVGLPLLVAAGLVTATDVALAAASIVPCVAGLAIGTWAAARMPTRVFVWTVDLLMLATGAMTVAKALA